jgi:2-(1,2-epoxy-1,2-dihydrophenyl)acetyl-CoA isomerase
MTDDAVHLSITDGVALLQMCRPTSRNAFSDEMKTGLRDAIGTLDGHPDVGAIVFTGAGGVFCAGGDLKAMLRRHETGEENDLRDVQARMEELYVWLRQLRDMPVPVITAVDGPAYGAGLALALCGDMVVASTRATFNASFAKLGAIPDCNLLWTLPRVVGLQRARELFYTARTVDAVEAQALGLCMEVVPTEGLLPRAMEIAQQMKNTSPLAYRLTKTLTAQSMQSDSDAMLALEAAAQAECLTSDYHFEAIARFADKTSSKFDFK